MDDIMRETLFNQAKAWTLQAGALIRENMHHPLNIDTKSGPKDLVTDMDREVEFFFARKIKQQFPDHFLLSEEGYGDDVFPKKGTIWIIDPIDGTMNFVHQRQNFAISVGVYHEGIGEIGIIYNVINNELFTATRGSGAFKNGTKLDKLDKTKTLQTSMVCLNHHWLTPNRVVDEKVMHQLIKDVRGTRTYGSAALELASVAEGVVDAYLTMRLEPWDVAAGRVVLEEVGGIISNVDGQAVDPFMRDSILACNPVIQKTLVNNYLAVGRKKQKKT
jgi:myo-inositol-1(or 4)-monophosphatase